MMMFLMIYVFVSATVQQLLEYPYFWVGLLSTYLLIGAWFRYAESLVNIQYED